MAEDAMKIARRMIAAFNRDDVDGVLAAFDEECVVEEPPQMPDSPAGGFRGHDGVRDWMANLRRFTGASFEVLGEEPVGDAIVAEVVARGQGESSEVPLEWRTHAVLRARNGKLVHLQAFLTREEAVEAASVRSNPRS